MAPTSIGTRALTGADLIAADFDKVTDYLLPSEQKDGDDTAAAETAAAESAYAEPTYIDDPDQEAAYAEATYGDTAYGDTAYGDTAYGDTAYAGGEEEDEYDDEAYAEAAYADAAYSEAAYAAKAYAEVEAYRNRPFVEDETGAGADESAEDTGAVVDYSVGEEDPEEGALEAQRRDDAAYGAKAHLRPYAPSLIDQQVFVQRVPGKGRCLFSRAAVKPGDILFVESPVLAATPQVNPELWELLQTCNKEEALSLPPVWHLAAITSLTKLNLAQQRAVHAKFVPDPTEVPSPDVVRVLQRSGLALDPHKYQKALNVWRFNGFGHHAENDGLILYDRISNMAHSCGASATWHYGCGDAFVLRARQHLGPGEEITISYIGDEDLYKPTHIRREKLTSWQFVCQCERCADPVDRCRGFRCPDCGCGTIFMKTDTDEAQELVTVAQPCTICRLVFSAEDITRYEKFEEAYIARLEETSKEFLSDLENVYQEAGRVFTQHHVMYELDTMLFEAYRDQQEWTQAAHHQQKRIEYAFSAQIIPGFVFAGMFEDLGDLLSNAAGDRTSGFFRNAIARAYETAFNSLIVLCGADHEYTLSAHAKFTKVMATH